MTIASEPSSLILTSLERDKNLHEVTRIDFMSVMATRRWECEKRVDNEDLTRRTYLKFLDGRGIVAAAHYGATNYNPRYFVRRSVLVGPFRGESRHAH